MAYDGSLNFDTRINTKGFNQDIGLMQKSVKKLGKTLALVFGTRALINFGKEALQVASDLQEVQNVVDVSFGAMANDINNFAKTALEQFGLSELSAKRYASSIGAMGSSMGFAAEQNAEMSKTVTGLIGDFSSFYNVQQDMAATALSAIWTAETETLKRYGILITEVNLQEYARRQGITKSIAKMTQQEKVMLRYNYVLEATKNAQGDFLRTQDSWANQTRILTERWKQFLGLIGNNLILVFTPAIKMLNNLLSLLISITEQFNAFYSQVTGQQITQQTEVTSSISDSVSEQEGLTDAVKDTNAELKRSVAGFDELNVLQKKTATGVSTSGISQFANLSTVSTALEPSEVQQINPIFQTLLDILQPLRDIDFSNLNNSLSNLKQSLKPFTKNIFDGLYWSYNNLFVPLSTWSIEDLLPAFLDLLASVIDNLNINLEILKPLGTWLWENFLKPLGQWTGGMLIRVLKQMNKDLEEFNRWLQGEDVKQENVFTTAKTDAKNLEELLGPLGTAIKEDINWLKGEDYKENVFTTAKTDAKTFSEFLQQATKDSEVMFGKFTTWIENNVTKPLDDAFWNLWDAVFINQDSSFVAMNKSITNFLNNWIGKFENFFNLITRGLNSLVDKLNSLSFDIPDWVPEIGGKEFSLNLRKFSEITLPKLSTGTVIPSSVELKRYLSNDKSTTQSDYNELLNEIRLLRQQETTIKFTGELSELARILKPQIDKENNRRGKSMKVVTE